VAATNVTKATPFENGGLLLDKASVSVPQRTRPGARNAEARPPVHWSLRVVSMMFAVIST
jgi:hypothetical protein